MLSARLVRMIEEHAEDLTREVLDDLAANPLTPAYHSFSRAELHRRVYDVYRHLGRWLGEAREEALAAAYEDLGRERRHEGIPLSQVVQALIRTKDHLWNYIFSAGLASSAVDLYQEEDLALRLARFFDRAIYHTVRGYESAPRERAAAP